MPDTKTAPKTDKHPQGSLELYKNGPYVVLSDGSTYDGAEGCMVAYVTDDGLQALEECYEFKGVEHDDVVHVTLADLLDAYNKVHGTDL